MAFDTGDLVNPIIPELLGKMDKQFVEIYTKYQGKPEGVV